MSTNSLTEKQKAFAYNVAIGMLQTHAARAAGYASPAQAADYQLRIPAVIEEINKQQAKFEKTADMTRKKVIDGLKDAIDIARMESDAQAMVAGWREIARICGYYAPEKHQLNITVAGATQLSQIQDMTDEELAALIIEGQAVRLDDAEDPPALPSPAEADDGSGSS